MDQNSSAESVTKDKNDSAKRFDQIKFNPNNAIHSLIVFESNFHHLCFGTKQLITIKVFCISYGTEAILTVDFRPKFELILP